MTSTFRLAFLAFFAALAASGQAPDPREIPVPPIETSLGALPGVDALPSRPAMPDVLVNNDGTRVRTREQWLARRQEIKRVLEYYAVGQAPPAPGNVQAKELFAESVLDGKARYRLLKLSFGPGRKLGLHVGLFTPAGDGPFPAVILQSSTPPSAPELPRQSQGPNQGRGENVLAVVGMRLLDGSMSPPRPPRGFPQMTAQKAAERYRMAIERGYALAMFNPNDCAEDTTLRNEDGSWAFRNSRFFPAYPGYDWGILAAWAWGASRVADYLESDAAIDASKLIVTGASRNGKSAMVAAAFDERLMGAPVVTGGGGVGAYRFAGPRGSETLDLMETKYPNWFSPHLPQFRGHVDKLPFDQHFFLALAAPRPFLALEGMTDKISLPEAVRQSMLAARPAYALHGATDRLGVHYANHGHAFTDEDWAAMLDFADKHLRGRAVDGDFFRFPSEAELDAAMSH
ncbi:MAG: hypothetical protein KDC27_07795 [Acidobacteria bacterium]|nr:hypothetical protein [Acidobacteriota bacterium]